MLFVNYSQTMRRAKHFSKIFWKIFKKCFLGSARRVIYLAVSIFSKFQFLVVAIAKRLIIISCELIFSFCISESNDSNTQMTQVENLKQTFVSPPLALSTYLKEQKENSQMGTKL